MRRSRTSRNRGQQDCLIALLRETRQEVGLRQADLAARLDAPQSYISKYESGERSLDIFELRQICQAMGIPIMEFMMRLEQRLAKGNDETE